MQASATAISAIHPIQANPTMFTGWDSIVRMVVILSRRWKLCASRAASCNDIAVRYPGVHDGDMYRDLPYVEAECAILAKQLAAMA